MRISGRGVSVLWPHGEPVARIPPPVADAPGASLAAPEDPTFRTRVSKDRQMVVNVSTRNICEIASTLAPGFTRTGWSYWSVMTNVAGKPARHLRDRPKHGIGTANEHWAPYGEHDLCPWCAIEGGPVNAIE